MKQQILKRLKWQSLFYLPISLGVFILLSQNAKAQGTQPDTNAQPDTCVSELASGTSVSPTVAHVGDTIFIEGVDASESAIDCGVTNTAAWLVRPDNTSELIFTNGTIAANQCGACPLGGLPTCLAPVSCVGAVSYTYIVSAADIDRNLNFTIPPGFPGAGSTLPLTGTNGYIQFFPIASGYSASGSGAVRGTGVQPVLVVTPSISVSKICDSNCFAYGAPITFHGMVCNTGNDILTNITAVDTPGATITFAATTSLGNPFLGLLATNECVSFTGTYQPSNNFCGPFPDTIVVSGTDGAGLPGLPDTNFVARTVFATNSAICTVCINPCISVTKNCATAIAGQPQLISGVVSNCGDIPITNVVVTDNIVGTITNIALLMNGQSVAYSTTIIASCGTNTDYVTASGLTVCGTPISASATNNCVGTESPCITVTKTCTTAVVGHPQTISGAVTNCGNVTLTNIVVADNIVGGITNVSSLAPGAFFFYSKTVTATCGGNTNVVTASAISTPCGTVVAARATNTCVTTESPCVSVTSTCTSAVVGGTQIISGTVTNCGNDILSNIVVSDSLLESITNFTTLAPGAGFSFSATLTAVCGGNTNIITASAISQCGTPVSAMSTNTCVTTESPCITVTKTCTTAVVGQPQIISGAVTNCGNVTLTNISVSDNIVGRITNGVTLAPGAFFLYSKTVTATCGGNTNVVTASAVSFPCGTGVSAMATNTCITTESPCIGVTSACSTAVVGGTQIITGVVTNCGNDILSNIVVTDSLFPEAPITNFVSLAPGGSFTYTNALTAVCGGNSNVVTASAISQCGTPVSASSTNVCVTTEAPCITVTKTCTTAVVGQPQTISGAVTNCGNVALTNIFVSDNIVGSITNVSLLPAGGFFFYSKTVAATCGGNTNVVTASAVSFPCGTPVSAKATNTCITTESPCVGISSTCSPAIAGQPQTISGTVTNCGNVTLTNVAVTQFSPLAPIIITNLSTPLGTLPPGGSFTFSYTFTADCVSTTNILTASGISICGTPASADSTNVCAVTQSPCITVTKTCTTAVVGQPQTISGAVTNCGNVTLTNISVSDNIVGSITNGITLAPGGFFLYSKTVTATCGGNTNVVTASALSVPCGTVVSAMATNTCISTESPCITVVGSCSGSVVGGLQFIGGAVTNCGNVALTNVTLTDSLIGSITNVPLLAPGGSFVFTNAITAVCGGNTNIVTASGESICGTPVSAKETNVCVATESPCITVTKTCTTAVVGQPQTISGAVTNCGNVTLTNISVTDNVVGSITNGVTLTPGSFFFYSKTVTAVCGGNTNIVTASGVSTCGSPVSAMATNTCIVTESPCITVTKTCTTAVVGQPQTISGAVTNCGNDLLTNITVVDNVVGSITNVSRLAPGGFFFYSKTVTATCGGNTNVVTASAISQCGTPVSAMATNTCITTESPCVEITSSCTPAIAGQPQTISGTVTNCGNDTLTNIVVREFVPEEPITITNVGTLPPGGFFTFSRTFTADCVSTTNILGVSGISICGTPVSADSTNVCAVTQSACITVTKTCTTAVAGQPQTISGAVTNCGNVTLTNISVSDNIVGSITNLSSLAPGSFFFYSKTVTAVCGGNTNVVTASALGLPCGTVVTAMATNTCIVTESPCINLVGSCSTVTCLTGLAQFVGGAVTNCGNVTLTNIVVTDSLLENIITNIALLPPGGSFVFTNELSTICGGTTNIITVSGVSICGTPVSAKETNVCGSAETPCITVTKTCTTAVVGQPQTISGAVTNCGNVTLTNIFVSDNIVGSITNVSALPPGGFFFYSKTVTAVCGGNTNIVTASGVSTCGTLVSARATNTCVTTESPCLTVVGSCVSGICLNGPMQIIVGSVTNCGNVTLTNIVVTDSLLENIITNIALLPPGGSFAFTNELSTICGGTTNIITASGVSICGTPVLARETNVCGSVESPCITVTKTCTTAVAGQPQTISGAVTNCGNVTLTNIFVSDNIVGNITNGITLAPDGFFFYSKTVTAVCGGNTNIVTASGVSTCGTLVSAKATNTCVTTESPCIIVVGSCSTGKSCSCPTAVDVQLIGGAVTNCGNVTLTNVTVTDSLIGTLTNVHLLPPGGSFVFTNKITSLCNGNLNIVTASGVSLCGTPVSAMETNFCNATETPCIEVTKDCSVVTCSNTTVSGTLLNCGNVTLTNIVVTDNLFGTITNISSLAPNTSVAFSISAMVSNSDMNVDFVTAIGTTICGTPVGDSDTNNCVLQLPGVGITKQVACFLGTNEEGSETCGIFSNSVVAISSDTQKPAFCYMITITNPGPVDLDNVSIVDTNPAVGTGFGDLTAGFPCITPVLPIGASCTYTFKATLASSLTNIVNITGFSPSGESVEAEASAVATVYPASISCLKQYTIDGGPLTNNANLFDNNPHTIVWYARVSNPSTHVNLADVILTDVTTNLACSITLPPFSLDAGSNILFALCTNTVIATNHSLAFTNILHVTADEFSLGTNHLPVCAHDITGSNIVASSECLALLTVSDPPGCPPVTTSLVSGFNATSISSTNDLWFNANLAAKGVPSSGATVFLNNAQLTITSKNGTFSYVVPNAEIIFSPSATCATTTFDGTQWVTTAPVTGTTEVLLTALGIQAPADLKGASVSFRGGFSADTTGISLKWKWGAAVYATDMTQPQYNNLGVKSSHAKACPYNNTDHAGTPENVKHLVVRGARGTGGKNFTGSFSGVGAVTLCPNAP